MAALLASSWGGVGATSSVGDAQVTLAGGQPCFSPLPGRSAPRDGFRLYALAVTDDEHGDWRTPPQPMWAFIVPPPGLPLASAAGACIRYGQLPGPAKDQGAARSLEPHRIYNVELNAGPADGSGPALGYAAQFCIGQTPAGDTEVRTVTWNARDQRRDEAVCERR